MNIQIVSGVGTGPTKMAAFDAALRQAGIANYNLLTLSSVIPPASSIIEPKAEELAIGGEWGDRLYVVLAENEVDTPNTEAWSGIGWVQDETNGKGLFVEHHGGSERTVQKNIEDSLHAFAEGRGMEFGPVQMKVRGIMCDRDPVCSLVAAIYYTTPWPRQLTEQEAKQAAELFSDTSTTSIT